MNRAHPALHAFLLVCIFGEMASAQSAPVDQPMRSLLITRSLKCTFPTYASATWDGDAPRIKTAQQTEFSFVLDSIEPKQGTARIVGNAGAEDLVVLVGDSTLSFVEQVPTGAVNVTSVYGWRDSRGAFKAVHSRHTAIGGPSPSQNYGFCQPW